MPSTRRLKENKNESKKEKKKENKTGKRGRPALADPRRKFNGRKWLRLCTVDDCQTPVRANGLCLRHTPKIPVEKYVSKRPMTSDSKKQFNGTNWRRLCSRDNCQMYSVKSGLCVHHFGEFIKQQQRTENVEMNSDDDDTPNWRRICSIKNCGKFAQSRGLCYRHLRESKNQQNSTENTTIFQQSSTNTAIKQLNIVSHHSTTINIPAGNYSQHGTFDNYQHNQRTTSTNNTTNQSQYSRNNDNVASTFDIDPNIFSMNTRSSDISNNTTTNEQITEINGKQCDYRLSTMNESQCQNLAMYKCSHCSSLYCVEHDLQHQEDLKEEITCLLDEAQELMGEIPSLKIDSGKKNCIEQFKHWMETILAKIDLRYNEFQTELNLLDSFIELNKDQWKKSLTDRMETKVISILMKQLQQHEINGCQINEVQKELTHIQKLYDLLNNQTLITIVNVEDNQIDFTIPRLIFPSISIDELSSMDESTIENHTESVQHLDQENILINGNTIYNPTDYNLFMIDPDSNVIIPLTAQMETNPVVSMDTAVESTNVRTTTDDSTMMRSSEIPGVNFNTINQSINERSEQFDLNSIELSIEQMQSLLDFPLNFEIEGTNSQSSSYVYDNPQLRQTLMDQYHDMELNLKSQSLTCQDMTIVAHHILTTDKPPAIVHLTWNKIKDVGMRHISEVLQSNKTIKTLNMQENRIGRSGIHCLSNALRWNKTLTSLSLVANRIGDDAVHYLSIALQANTALTTLDLSENQIRNTGAHYLSDALKSNGVLTTLRLSRNLIRDEGAQYLCDALESNDTLVKLQLSWNTISQDILNKMSMALQRNKTTK